jgi:cell division septation protein DedD
MIDKAWRIALVLLMTSVIGNPVWSQTSRGLPRSAAAPAIRVPHGCPTPVGIVRGISPGEVAITTADAGTESQAPILGGRTVFLAAGARTRASADTGRHRADSSARAKSATTVRTPAAGEVAVGTSVATGGKRATVAHAVARRRRSWTVQVASYETFDEAQAMQEILCGRGYEARILGAVRPYDVRVGRFPTSDSALVVARRLGTRHLTVFVTPSD